MMKVDRKVHKASTGKFICDFCNLEIKKGEEYIRYRGLYQGQFLTDRRHLKCSSEYLIAKKCEECKGGINLPEKRGYLHCTC